MPANGNPVLDRAKAHFGKLAAVEPVAIEVPEWDLVGYAFPQTLEDRHRVYMNEGLERILEAVLVGLCDETGARIFADSERNTLLRRVDPDVLIRAGAAILDAREAMAATVDEAAKVLAQTPTSTP